MDRACQLTTRLSVECKAYSSKNGLKVEKTCGAWSSGGGLACSLAHIEIVCHCVTLAFQDGGSSYVFQL